MTIRQPVPAEAQTPAPDYNLPGSVEETIAVLESWSGQARIIAGGTDVLPDIRGQKIRPRCLVDITRLPGLDQIEISEKYVQVGAAVTFANLKDAAFVNRRVHALAEAARSVGALAIQNAATWVGNLVQAMPAADGAIVALALAAEARIVDRAGAAWQPVEGLFRGPGRSVVDPTRQLITHVRFPHYPGLWGTAWQRVGRRPSLVLPILNCAVSLRLDAAGRRIEQAAIALGPVSPCPFRARQAERFLAGQLPDEDVFAQAVRLILAEAKPRDSLMRASRHYRLAIIPPVVETALQTAAQRARDESG
jgi:carbon-monoxide dehydrogenase medium subunit